MAENDYPKTLHRLLDGKPDSVTVNSAAEEKSAKMRGFSDEPPAPKN